MPQTRQVRAAGRRGVLRRELVAFIAAALVVLLAVAAATILITERIARDSARREAEATAARMARFLVQPLLSNVLAGEQEDRRDLDQVVAIRMGDGSVTAIIVRTADGEIVYASDRTLEGTRVPPTPELTAAINGRISSTIDETSEIGAAALRTEPQLEVYAPIRAGDRRLALEAYFSTAMIEADAALLRARAMPLALGALLVLQLLQLPIAMSLTRRLSRHERERTELVRRHLAASDRERRSIAADLHDGPVQDLTGVSYGLSALRPNVPERQQGSVDRMVAATRNAVASLRRLMVDIYPPDLSGPGLAVAMDDLAVPLREAGLTVHVDTEPLPAMSSASAAVLYRTAKEALANVARHAQARTAWIRLEEAEHAGQPAVRLTVEDDGVGLPGRPAGGGPPGPVPAAAEGHLGLRLVRDRIAEGGGVVSVGHRVGGGTRLEALLPVGDGIDPPASGAPGPA